MKWCWVISSTFVWEKIRVSEWYECSVSACVCVCVFVCVCVCVCVWCVVFEFCGDMWFLSALCLCVGFIFVYVGVWSCVCYVCGCMVLCM